MRKRSLILPRLKCLVLLWMSCTAFAQTQQSPALFFRESWKDTAQVPVSQAFVSNANLQLKLYGPGKNDIEIVGSTTNERNPPHIWTGLCTPTCALALRHNTNY